MPTEEKDRKPIYEFVFTDPINNDYLNDSLLLMRYLKMKNQKFSVSLQEQKYNHEERQERFHNRIETALSNSQIQKNDLHTITTFSDAQIITVGEPAQIAQDIGLHQEAKHLLAQIENGVPNENPIEPGITGREISPEQLERQMICLKYSSRFKNTQVLNKKISEYIEANLFLQTNDRGLQFSLTELSDWFFCNLFLKESKYIRLTVSPEFRDLPARLKMRRTQTFEKRFIAPTSSKLEFAYIYSNLDPYKKPNWPTTFLSIIEFLLKSPVHLLRLIPWVCGSIAKYGALTENSLLRWPVKWIFRSIWAIGMFTFSPINSYHLVKAATNDLDSEKLNRKYGLLSLLVGTPLCWAGILFVLGRYGFDSLHMEKMLNFVDQYLPFSDWAGKIASQFGVGVSVPHTAAVLIIAAGGSLLILLHGAGMFASFIEDCNKCKKVEVADPETQSLLWTDNSSSERNHSKSLYSRSELKRTTTQKTSATQTPKASSRSHSENPQVTDASKLQITTPLPQTPALDSAESPRPLQQ